MADENQSFFHVYVSIGGFNFGCFIMTILNISSILHGEETISLYTLVITFGLAMNTYALILCQKQEIKARIIATISNLILFSYFVSRTYQYYPGILPIHLLFLSYVVIIVPWKLK